MSLALNRESFFWHKVHSLTGIIPVGFYMLQHLTLNSFTLAGPERFNQVIQFFEGMPKHILLALEIAAIWLPLAFHAVYGLFIIGRGQGNYFEKRYKWSQNRMYTLQRWSGIVIFFFLIFHVISTTGVKYARGADEILYDAMQAKLVANYYLIFVVYLVGILASAYHLSYGIWNFCIRWGITISEAAQIRVQKVSLVFFVVVTLLGWSALTGFLIHKPIGNDVGSATAPMHARSA